MSGLIKQVVGTLGILLVMAGNSHAQNAPTQPVQGEGALSVPNQAIDSQTNTAPLQQAPVLQPTPTAQTGNGAQATSTPPTNGTVIVPATTANGDNSSANTPSANQAPANQVPASPNNAPANSAPQDATAPAINNPQNSETAQGTGNLPAQPLPPINAGETVVGIDKSTLPHDLSPYGMFMQADWVVKTVMIGLAMASLLTWIIFVAKTIELSIAKAKVRNAVREIVSSHSLSEAIEKFANKKNVSGRLVNAAANEVRMSINAVDGAGSSGVKERVTSALSRIEAHAGRRMAGGSAILATIGSISPFVGLFGTVWGIMNAFIGISKSQVTNLAVVAPGIAEALLATAIGLVAAIPAVVIYNYLAKSITGYRQIVTDASTGIERLVSRDLDFREAQRKSPRPIQPLTAE